MAPSALNVDADLAAIEPHNFPASTEAFTANFDNLNHPQRIQLTGPPDASPENTQPEIETFNEAEAELQYE